MAHHELRPSPSTVHWGYWDAKLPPVLRINSLDTVLIDTVSGGRQEVGEISFFREDHKEIAETVLQGPGPHILTGPIFINDACPGDVLEVKILDIRLTQDWGWNVIRPYRGSLPEDFPFLSRRIIKLDRKSMRASLDFGIDVPLNPFFGIIGVAPPEWAGRVSSIEPREYGGNIDNKEFTAGTSLFIPVFVEGALLSIGDGHAVQGDGEVCLTALETCLEGEFSITLHKNFSLNRPRAITRTHFITMGFDPDLDLAAKIALRDMIAWLVKMMGWSPEESYVFCSLCCDLRVTQLVDGNKGINS